MTQENKELLLKDLCARLPYNVKLDCKWKTPGPNGTYCMIIKMNSFVLNQIYHTDDTDVPFNEVKPYLFPLSSMTEEQQEEFDRIYADDMQVVACNLKNKLDGKPYETNYGHYRHIDWLNAHHFDYRGLIEKGLAIDATGLNVY